MNKSEFYDVDFGIVKVKLNRRARNIIFYNRRDGLHITVPPGVREKEVQHSLNRLRLRLLNSKISCKRQLIDLDFRIDADLFKLSFSEGPYQKFLLRQNEKGLEIICPVRTDFEDEKLQEWFHRVIEEALRKSAKEKLPQRLQSLSLHYGLPFEQVKINTSKGRWGSCSAAKRINLSCYLLLLPLHLIDYVLLHELCHTKEMNHSDRFWILMNQFTDNKALALRKELKGYKTDFV